MSKKKSKKNIKKKITKQKNLITIEKKSNTKINKNSNNQQKELKNKDSTKKQIVETKNVIYNLPLQKEIEKEQTTKKTEQKIKYVGLKEYITLKIKEYKNKKNTKKTKKRSYKEKIILNQNLEKKVQKIEKNFKKYNFTIKTLAKLYRNLHVVFNSIIIITFIILLIGTLKIEIYKTGTIIYFGSLLLFLIIVAISQNRYLSGKIFTTIITLGMLFIIINFQKTYDFISILNKKTYEYKTYYVAAFDVQKNRNIHGLNNKKICVLKENRKKTSLVLNTKIDNVTYKEFNDTDTMFEEFYSQKCRGIIVNKNQLKYLENDPKTKRKIKKVYEFKAVTVK